MPKISLTSIANILSIGVNSLLIILKLVIGFLFNSISLIADGFDSVMDVVSASIAGVGERISRKPPDRDHPFGHQKFQLISSLVIVLTMFISSYFIAQESINRLIEATSYDLEIWILVAASVSLVTKLSISIALMKIGKKLKSTVYIANAKNYRTDAISSIFVIIAYIGGRFDVWWLDPACAFVIVALILFTGFEIAKMSLPELLDKGPSLEIVEELKSTALACPEIKEVHVIRLRSILGSYTGDFHILVDPELSILEAHEISERVKAKLESTGHFRDLLIHIEPYIPEESLEG
ncbi:MAG: cation transporter [Candidatus Heimdallarchaeota archaeon]|nr:cation transporter [Candidatus Heimdallarchaeota archaeon]